MTPSEQSDCRARPGYYTAGRERSTSSIEAIAHSDSTADPEDKGWTGACDIEMYFDEVGLEGPEKLTMAVLAVAHELRALRLVIESRS